IQGELRVVGQGDFRLHFSKFPRLKGSATHQLTILGQTEGMKLEVDPDRTSSFLDVKLEPRPKEPGKAPQWTLTARVKADEATGSFPRDDDPKYRDSAIYVRPVGTPDSRATRIAVEGIASD